MYTVNEALQALRERGITDSSQMVRRWLREGVIQGERANNRKTGWRIPTSELERFIAARHPEGEIRRLEAEIKRLSRENEQLQNERHVKTCNMTAEEPLYRAQTVDEFWDSHIQNEENVPVEILREARRTLDQGLADLKTTHQYICPFSGKRYGSAEKLIRAAIPLIIKWTIADCQRREERRIREQEKDPLYVDQL